MAKIKLSEILLEKGYVSSLQRAEALVLAGKVKVNGERAKSVGCLIDVASAIAVEGGEQYVGRGALKLEGALAQFKIDLNAAVCADVGSSTGGFTEVMLKHAAAKVYAIDVGYGELAWKLRQDARVVVMERTNARYVEALPEKINFASIDVSFISLKLILPQVRKWWADEASSIVALIKPQFEARKEQVGKGGIVRDPAVHGEVLGNILNWCQEQGIFPQALMKSPIEGTHGNVEFLVFLKPTKAAEFDIQNSIASLIGL